MLVVQAQVRSNKLARGDSSQEPPQRAKGVGMAVKGTPTTELGPLVWILPLCYPGRILTQGCLVTLGGARPPSGSTLYGRWKKSTQTMEKATAAQTL